MRSMKLTINHNAERDEIENDRCRDHSIAQTRTGQTFRTAVIFGDSLQDNAPPEVSINLNVPFIPTGIDRVAPPFLFEQLEDLTEQMVTIARFIAPENAAAQTARGFRVRRQMFVRANDATRRAFEMKPGEVTGKSAHERLHEG